MDIEEQLFGSVRKKPYIGNLPVPVQKLLEAFPHEEEGDEKYVIHFFCSGCGTVLPVIHSAVEKIAGNTLPSYEGKYIGTEKCDLCSEGFEGAELKDIPIQ